MQPIKPRKGVKKKRNYCRALSFFCQYLGDGGLELSWTLARPLLEGAGEDADF